MSRHELAARQLKAERVATGGALGLAVMVFVAILVGFLLATGGKF